MDRSDHGIGHCTTFDELGPRPLCIAWLLCCSAGVVPCLSFNHMLAMADSIKWLNHVHRVRFNYLIAPMGSQDQSTPRLQGEAKVSEGSCRPV